MILIFSPSMNETRVLKSDFEMLDGYFTSIGSNVSLECNICHL